MNTGLAIDLGTARTLVLDGNGRVILDEPTVSAIDLASDRLIAFGSEAVGMAGRTSGQVAVVRPVREGQLVDLELTDQIVAEIVGRAKHARVYRPEVVCCVPGSATGVQRRALERSFRKSGVKQIEFLEHAVACGIGTGLRLDEPVASMVLDVGAGTADMAVMALGGVVTDASLPIGGSNFDEAIRQLCRRSFDLVLPPGTAEAIKLAIGTAWPSDERKVEVLGRDLGNGQPRTIVLGRSEVFNVVCEHVDHIIRAAVKCIVESPPDLANDLLTKGLYLAGGSALLDGFARRLATAAAIPIHLVEEPETVAVAGAVRALRAMKSGWPPPALGARMAAPLNI